MNRSYNWSASGIAWSNHAFPKAALVAADQHDDRIVTVEALPDQYTLRCIPPGEGWAGDAGARDANTSGERTGELAGELAGR